MTVPGLMLCRANQMSLSSRTYWMFEEAAAMGMDFNASEKIFGFGARQLDLIVEGWRRWVESKRL